MIVMVERLLENGMPLVNIEKPIWETALWRLFAEAI
jgi:hypothetical protein